MHERDLAMNTKHIPGPWYANDRDVAESKCSGTGNRVIASCGMSTNPEIDRANAARIAKCVNACEGIENPAAMREIYEELKKVSPQDGINWVSLSILFAKAKGE